MNARPRVLFVGRNRLSLPLPDALRRKWDAVAEQLDLRLLGTAASGDPVDDGRFALAAAAARGDGVLFYLRLPGRVRRELASFRPDAVVAADPFVGAVVLLARRLSRQRPRVIVEVHGDWRTFARLYGSPARRLAAAPLELVARWTLRHADATRALSGFTSGLVVEARGRPATRSFPTYSDLQAFGGERQPLPERPTALFVGALERYKNVDGLAAAWREVARRVPDALLVVVGKGARPGPTAELEHTLPDQVRSHAELSSAEVAAALDAATVLVLPSWPEGLGRVVFEAFARGRGVVATDAGGIPDMVTDGVEGLLVPPGDGAALVDALVRVLTDPALAERLGAAAAAAYPRWHSTPENFAGELRQLVDDVLAGAT